MCLCLKAKHANLTQPCYTLLYTKGISFNCMIDFSKSQTIQKHVEVRQTLAPLALFLMHVIALATRPPCITSWLNDRLIHLWVWVVKLTKALSPLLMEEMSARKEICKETVQKSRLSTSFFCTNYPLGLFMKSVAKRQGVLALFQKSLYTVYYSKVYDMDELPVLEYATWCQLHHMKSILMSEVILEKQKRTKFIFLFSFFGDLLHEWYYQHGSVRFTVQFNR